jgi:hypothetical protein
MATGTVTVTVTISVVNTVVTITGGVDHDAHRDHDGPLDHDDHHDGHGDGDRGQSAPIPNPYPGSPRPLEAILAGLYNVKTRALSFISPLHLPSISNNCLPIVYSPTKGIETGALASRSALIPQLSLYLSLY